MNISEMHVWFRQYAQQMGMQNTRAILPEQIDLLINTSINDVVNKIIAENISNRNDRVITDNSKIGQINALRTLYDVVTVEQNAVAEFNEVLSLHKDKPYMVSLNVVNIKNIKPLYFIDFSIKYHTNVGETEPKHSKLFPVRLIDRAYLADTLQDYILAPRFRSPIGVISNRYWNYGEATESVKEDNLLEIYTGDNDLHNDIIEKMSIASLDCSIIKEPAKVKYISDIKPGENVNCDLPESLHYDILKHAVDLYRLSIAGSIAAAQEQAQNQARENLRNNIREE